MAVAAFSMIAAVASYWLYLESSFSAQRAGVLEAGRLRASQITQATREQLWGTFRTIDVALLGVRNDFLLDRDYFRASAYQASSLLLPSSEVRFAIYGADGALLVASGVLPVRASIADASYFIEARRRGEDFLDVGAAEKDEASGTWAVPLVRPIHAGGAFAGVIVALVSPRFLSDELDHIVLGTTDVLGAVHTPDGTYLARNVDIDGLLGLAVTPSRPYLQPDAPASGVFTAEATYQPVERIYGWARLRDLPVVVFVGLTTADLLAPLEAAISGHRSTNLVGTLALLLCAGGLLLLWARLARQEAMYHALFDQNHSVKLVSDPRDGRIMEANAAAAEFYGYSSAELARMNIAQINCLSKEEIARCMAEAKAGGRPSFVFPHRLASGEIRMVEVFSGPVEFEGRTALYSIIHDISRRFELEARLRESEARYRTLFEVSPSGILVVERDGTLSGWNEAALRILRVDAGQLVARSFAMYERDGSRVTPERRPSMRCFDHDIRDELYYVLDAQGERIWININGRCFSAGDGDAAGGAVLTFSDITHVVQLEEQLLISDHVFEGTTEGIMVTDKAGRIVRVNRAFTEITGYSAQDIIGQRPRVLSSGRHDVGFYRAMFESLERKKSWEGEITNRRKDGKLFVERAVISALTGEDGAISGYVALLSDITLRKEKDRELWRRANFDSLTGLPNRTLFMDRLNQALAQSYRIRGAVAVLFIDLDHFKQVNDRWGHAAGDELLRLTAGRIASALRTEDTVARVGGDEFVVLLPTVATEAGAVQVAHKVLDLLLQPFALRQGEAAVSACIGVAVSSGDAIDADGLVGQADAAMYRGKTTGRSRVVSHGEEELQEMDAAR